MNSIGDLIKGAGFNPVKYSSKKDVIILFTALERNDNDNFVSKVTKAVKDLDAIDKKITPKNIAIRTGFTIKDIELNLHEIVNIMDALGID